MLELLAKFPHAAAASLQQLLLLPLQASELVSDHSLADVLLHDSALNSDRAVVVGAAAAKFPRHGEQAPAEYDVCHNM